MTEQANLDSSLRSRHTHLAPVQPSDVPLLYAEELGADGFRWRFRGTTPSPEVHARSLWEDVLFTQVVRSNETGAAVALATLYRPNLAHGYVYFALLSFERFKMTGLALEGAAVVISHAFRTWNLRKIYIDTLGFNYDQFGSLVPWLLEEEGRLSECEYYDGRFWDRVLLTLNRSTWEAQSARVQRVLAR